MIAHPRVVTITFADDPDRGTLEAHAAWMVQSSWLGTVGAEYGVGLGSVLGVLERTEAAPATASADDVRAWLVARWMDGTLPRPSDGDLSNVLYVVHYPMTTTLTLGASVSCTDFLAYHSTLRTPENVMVFAAEVSCPLTAGRTLTQREDRERATSHELFEAATDPLAGVDPAFVLHDPSDPWRALGGELADLCVLPDENSVVRDGPFVAARVWSAAAAATLRDDPCVPAPEGTFFDVAVLPHDVPRARPGETVLFGVRGWASGPVAEWGVAPVVLGSSPITAHLDAARLGDGTSTTLRVAVSPSAPEGTLATLVLLSFHAPDDVRTVPVAVRVAEPCSSHATCDTCATQGCGWCAATGRCELAGDGRSAESDCAGEDWAPWLGACPGVCASHAGSCADCASTGGCGWCEGVGCLPAGGNGSHSLDGACTGAAWSFVPAYCPP